MNRRLFIIAFLIVAHGAFARDEDSIKGLCDLIVTLAPDVDPGEASEVSLTVHTTSRSLAREYRIVGPPVFQNFLIHIGVRQRGYCHHWARDIGAPLKELKLKTIELHWGAAFVGTDRENNCLVLTARGQRFENGIVIDAWRHAGRLYWGLVTKDHKNDWREDIAETALLQNNEPAVPRPKTATAQR